MPNYFFQSNVDDESAASFDATDNIIMGNQERQSAYTAEASRIPLPPLIAVSPADVATVVAARLRTQLPHHVPQSTIKTSLPTSALEALVTQVANEAVDVLAAAWSRAVAEETARAEAATVTHYQQLANIAGQWNQRSHTGGLLGSPGLGLSLQEVGRTLHVTSQEIHGVFVRAVGSLGASVGEFHRPVALASSPDETRLLVVDLHNARVVVADARNGRSLSTLQGPAGTLVQPSGVAMVPRTGQVLVLDWQRDLVVVFAGVDDDTVVRTLGDGNGRDPRQLNGPHGVAVLDEGDAVDRPVAVVADTGNDRLSLFFVDDNTLLRHVGSCGAGPGQFNSPSAVSVVSSEVTGIGEAWLAVADGNNHRVQVLTLVGVVVHVLVAGDGVGPLSDVMGGVTVCVATGEVLVADTSNHRVLLWRLSDGGGCRVVCGTGVAGAGHGEFNGPSGVTMSDGALWVSDNCNHRLCLFR
jgi:hypothetical protein